MNAWTRFTGAFLNLHTGKEVEHHDHLLTVILADGLNLGLTDILQFRGMWQKVRAGRHQAHRVPIEALCDALRGRTRTEWFSPTLPNPAMFPVAWMAPPDLQGGTTGKPGLRGTTTSSRRFCCAGRTAPIRIAP
ncbi:hypothetical protein [Deinococcus arcticus]|uniref:hypothetical protein n=1 Tax=Deinococcus arcticus TaxID=2136176 RepID=UPI0038BCEEFE